MNLKDQIRSVGVYKVSLMTLTNHHAMKTYGELEVQAHALLTSALDADDGWSLSRPDSFTLLGK
jgi:hypothetical protein